MVEKQIAPGSIVSTTYKTGRYLAELVEWSKERSQALVKILAVLRHPTQGDLHYPGRVDVAFQQRRALAFNEKTWVHSASVTLHEGEVPSYEKSLKTALEAEVDKLKQKGDAWSKRSIQELEDLRKDYFKS